MSEDARAKWLAERRTGIGGSDAAALMGVSRWKTPLALWAEKTGLADLSTEETEYQRWGRIMERPIADEYAALTGRKVIDLGQYTISRHPTIPIMICTHDFLVDDEQKGRGPLSIKTAAAWKAGEWEDAEAPLEYEIQLQDEIAVAGAEWGSFAVLVWGKGVQWFDRDRNQRFIAALETKCVAFWESVQSGSPPEPSGADADVEALRKLYPKEIESKVVALPADAAEWDREIEEAAAAAKELKAKDTEMRNRIRAAMGDAEIGLLPDGSQWTWKTQERAGYTVEPSTSRVLKKRKGTKK